MPCVWGASLPSTWSGTKGGQITSMTGFRSTTMIVMLSVDPFSLAMVASLAERFSRSPPFVWFSLRCWRTSLGYEIDQTKREQEEIPRLLVRCWTEYVYSPCCLLWCNSVPKSIACHWCSQGLDSRQLELVTKCGPSHLWWSLQCRSSWWKWYPVEQ